jgi:hypothetical protein
MLTGSLGLDTLDTYSNTNIRMGVLNANWHGFGCMSLIFE